MAGIFNTMAEYKDVTLLEVLDHVLDKGVVIKGEVIISVADVDLIYVGLQLLVASPDKVFPALYHAPD